MEAFSKRLHTIRAHLTSQIQEVVICAAYRTPLTKARKGGLMGMEIDDIMGQLYSNLLQKTGINPNLVEDVVIGNAIGPNEVITDVRSGQVRANLPNAPLNVINRFCASGIQAVAKIAQEIAVGTIQVGLAGGVEMMSKHSMTGTVSPDEFSERVFNTEEAQNVLLPMGITSDNVVKKFQVDRNAMDSFSLASHQKAAQAIQEGRFSNEIIPIQRTVTDENGNTRKVDVNLDDGVMTNTSIEKLQKLKPAFNPDGATTAGNSSQVTDGAAVVLLANRQTAQRLNLPILGRWIQYSVVGVPPETMGVGPAFAIPKVLSKAQMDINQIDVFELNEAFASQALWCTEQLKIPPEKINPNGGAIAIGHPLGCTGARQVSTLLNELKRQGKRYGIISMCIGGGQGAAAIIENLS